MEIIRIIPSDSKLWEQVWRLYTDSFPEYERRRISSHSRASEDPAFHTFIAVENGHLLALLFHWSSNDLIYIEHIAVNPLMRGQNIGTKILGDFMAQNKDKKVILEIDPPVDDVSVKRLRFYEKLGFKVNDYDYTHPSYSKNGQGHKLVILSYPDKIDQEQFVQFSEFVETMVLKYID